MLTVQNLTKHFGGVVALTNCTFHVESGSVTALVGPNGAGKTTLFDVVSGFVPPDSGRVLLDDRDVTNAPPHRVANAGVSRTFQQVRLFKNLTILDHLLMAADNRDCNLFLNLGPTRSVPRDKLQAHLERFYLTKPLETCVADLSYGQRKLLDLAMATLKPHRLLLLDEPVAGVNAVVQQQIEELLMQFKTATGSPAFETVLVIEHDMEFVRRLADKVVVMDAGAVLVTGQPDQVLRDERVLEAYLGR